jgi:hypothetical protein
MKVLLRNTDTGLFYAGPDQWTNAHAQAVEFEGPHVALDTVSSGKLASVEVVIHFEESIFDFPIQIVGLGG